MPFSEDDKEAMKYRAEKCFQVLGFSDSANVSCYGNRFQPQFYCRKRPAGDLHGSA